MVSQHPRTTRSMCSCISYKLFSEKAKGFFDPVLGHLKNGIIGAL